MGAKGFKAIWTEVKEKRQCSEDEFRCTSTEFCISQSLKCNGINNCGVAMGVMDKSDESECEFDTLWSKLFSVCSIGLIAKLSASYNSAFEPYSIDLSN